MNTYKKLTIGLMLLGSLSLTACGQDVPSASNPVPAKPVVAESEKPATKEADETSPSFAPTDPKATMNPEDGEKASAEEIKAIEKDVSEAPLGIDVEKAIAEYGDPKLEETFPASDFDVAEGTRFGLETYQGIVNLRNLYEPRDGSKDFELLNVDGVADRVTKEFLDETKAGIDEAGRLALLPNADVNGSFGDTAEGINIDPVTSVMPVSEYPAPGVSVGYDEKTETPTILISGKRLVHMPVESGETVDIYYEYFINVAPAGDGWIVTDIGTDWSSLTAKVVNG